MKQNTKKQALIDELKVKWYNWLCLNEPGFKTLGLDERGKYVNCIVEIHLDELESILNPSSDNIPESCKNEVK
jgi:hypothetical protein